MFKTIEELRTISKKILITKVIVLGLILIISPFILLWSLEAFGVPNIVYDWRQYVASLGFFFIFHNLVKGAK